MAVPQPKSYDEGEEESESKMSDHASAGSKMNGGVSGLMEGKSNGDGSTSPTKLDVNGGGGHKERDSLKEEVVSRQKQMKNFRLMKILKTKV